MKKLLIVLCLCTFLYAPSHGQDHPVENLQPTGDLTPLLDAISTAAPSRAMLINGAGKPTATLNLDSPNVTFPSTVVMSVTGLDTTGATDSTAAFQAAVESVDALPTGGTLYLPAGTIKLATGSITFSKPVRIIGAGAGSVNDPSGPGAAAGVGIQYGGTVLQTTGNGDLLTFTANGCSISDVMVVNTASGYSLTPTTPAPTSGAGLQFVQATNAHITRVGVTGFWDNIHVTNGIGWQISGGQNYGALDAGLLVEDQAIPDGGDQSILGCYFGNVGGVGTGIRIVSGSGLKVANCKFNGWQHHVVVAQADGVGCSDLLLANNSFENASDWSVFCEQSGSTGVWNNIEIKANQFALDPKGVYIGPGCNACVIGDNDIHVDGTAIQIAGGDNNVVLANVLSGQTAHVLITNNATNVEVARQKFRGLNSQTVRIQDTSGANVAGGGARIDYGESKPLPGGIGATPVTIATLVPAAYSGASAHIFLHGISQGHGAFALSATRQIVFGSSGTATVTTLGTDTLTGVPAGELTLSAMVGSGNQVSLQVSTSNTSGIAGSGTLSVDGNLSNYQH